MYWYALKRVALPFLRALKRKRIKARKETPIVIRKCREKGEGLRNIQNTGR